MTVQRAGDAVTERDLRLQRRLDDDRADRGDDSNERRRPQ
jgi:hypothetical protein